MDANQRVDYFRSEMIGNLDRLEKRMAELNTENLKLLRDFEKRLEALTRTIRDVEMSVR